MIVLFYFNYYKKILKDKVLALSSLITESLEGQEIRDTQGHKSTMILL